MSGRLFAQRAVKSVNTFRRASGEARTPFGYRSEDNQQQRQQTARSSTSFEKWKKNLRRGLSRRTFWINLLVCYIALRVSDWYVEPLVRRKKERLAQEAEEQERERVEQAGATATEEAQSPL